jgi:hypothetical protein
MVAQVLDENLRHLRTIRLRRGGFGSEPPFDIGPDTLFVAYSAWAEMTCFKVLGWKFPTHIFDQHTAYLAASNILLPYNPDEVRKKQSKGLSHACRAYGLEGWERIDKGSIAESIGNGTWRGLYSPEDVAIPGAGRCCACPALVELRRQMHRADSSPRHADRHGALEFGAGE